MNDFQNIMEKIEQNIRLVVESTNELKKNDYSDIKKKYISISVEDESGSYICTPENYQDYLISEVETLLEEEGNWDINISLVKMTDKEYNKLPEYNR
jgi:hypothetical protein